LWAEEDAGTRDSGCADCSGPIGVSGQSLTAQHGGSGGTAHTDVCPDNQVVIGYRGTLTGPDVSTDIVLVGSVQTICGELLLGGSANDQVLTASGATLAPRGLSQLSPWTRMCPADQVVVGFSGRSGSAFDAVAFVCAHWTVSRGALGTLLSSDPPTKLAQVGGVGGEPFDDACPPGEMARGTSLRSGEFIDAFGLVCGAPAIVADGGAE
jgi:hypothetical protein